MFEASMDSLRIDQSGYCGEGRSELENNGARSS